MSPHDTPLVWLHGEIKSPPLSKKARLLCGFLLRGLQQGHRLSMPDSRPMPSIGARCHELRVPDGPRDWRIVYRIDDDAIVIADVFAKTSQKTPKQVIATCRARFALYDRTTKAST